MRMRIRLRGPDGVTTISLDDSATVADLQIAVAENTFLEEFDLKLGYPPQPLDLPKFDLSLKLSEIGVKLDGEQLLATAPQVEHSPPSKPVSEKPVSEPAESESDDETCCMVSRPVKEEAPVSTAEKMSSFDPLSLVRKPSPFDPKTGKDPPEIPVPTHDGTLILKIMPDDNSCLFRALGSAVLTDDLDIVTELRSIVAQTIQADPDLFTEAVLEKDPDEYFKWIQKKDSWGGGIEIAIIAQHFDVEIASINVQDLRVDRFNEAPEGFTGKRMRVILVYTGIHFDVIALRPDGSMTHELDEKQFDSGDDIILEAARELCRKLQASHYYTDTAGFTVLCNVCRGEGRGEKWATEHAKATGHLDFEESQ